MRRLRLAVGVAVVTVTGAETARAEPTEPASPTARLERATAGLTVEAPFAGGVGGGLGSTILKHDDARATGRQRGLGSAAGVIGPHLGLGFALRIFYASASYEYSILVGSGAMHRASLAAGVSLPLFGNMLAPFVGPSLRVWSLATSGDWSTGLRASPVLDVGTRFMPFIVSGRHGGPPARLGLVVHGSVPVGSEGGWFITAGIALFGGLD